MLAMVPTRSTWLLGALLLGALAPAQQTEQPPVKTAQQEFEELTKAYSAAQLTYMAEQRRLAEEARAKGERAPALSMAGPAAEWLPKFQAAADKYKGTDGAVPFLVWIGGNSRGDARDAVVATLLEAHLGSPALGSAMRLIGSVPPPMRATRLDGAPEKDQAAAEAARKATEEARKVAEAKVRANLAKVIEKSPHQDVQAQALLARANLVLEAGEEVDAVARTAAIADVRQANERATDAELKERCEGILFEQDHLAIGMTAPEIEGNDLDGVAFKLSDYRGKVILLDYWGYW